MAACRPTHAILTPDSGGRRRPHPPAPDPWPAPGHGKNPGDLVTVADREAEVAITAALLTRHTQKRRAFSESLARPNLTRLTSPLTTFTVDPWMGQELRRSPETMPSWSPSRAPLRRCARGSGPEHGWRGGRAQCGVWLAAPWCRTPVRDGVPAALERDVDLGTARQQLNHPADHAAPVLEPAAAWTTAPARQRLRLHHHTRATRITLGTPHGRRGRSGPSGEPASSPCRRSDGRGLVVVTADICPWCSPLAGRTPRSRWPLWRVGSGNWQGGYTRTSRIEVAGLALGRHVRSPGPSGRRRRHSPVPRQRCSGHRPPNR